MPSLLDIIPGLLSGGGPENIIPAGAQGAPADGGGLLSQAAQNGFLSSPFLSNLGAGILAANRRGIPLGAAVGEGLLAGNQGLRDSRDARLRREQSTVRNDLIRSQIAAQRTEAAQRTQRSEALQQYQGLLASGVSATDPRALGLLAQAAPGAFAQSAANQAFSTARVPSIVQEAQFVHPNDPEAQKRFVAAANARNGGSSKQLEDLVRALTADRLLGQISDEQTERETAAEAADVADAERVDSLNSGLSNLVRLYDLNEDRRGTALESGATGQGLRRAGVDLLGEGLDIAQSFGFGEGGAEQRAALTATDNFNKRAAELVRNLADGFEGFNTDAGRRLLQEGSLSSNVTPDTNAEIIAVEGKKILAEARRRGIQLDPAAVAELEDRIRKFEERGEGGGSAGEASGADARGDRRATRARETEILERVGRARGTPITEQDIRDTMRANNMTRAQVIERLGAGAN